MKKWIKRVFLLTLTTVALSATSTFAASLTFNGMPVQSDVPPVLLGGRTMVPVKVINDLLGGSTQWDDATRSITLIKEDKIITMTLGSTKVIVNGSWQQLDVPAQAIHGRTMVPLSFVANTMGAVVTWDPGTKTAIIETKGFAEGPAATESTLPMEMNPVATTGNAQGAQVNKLVKLVDIKIVKPSCLEILKKSRQDPLGNNYPSDNLIEIYQSNTDIGGGEFYLNGQFTKISGVVAISERSSQGINGTVEIYADDELIYDSGVVDIKTEPFSINLDVSGVKWMKIKTIRKKGTAVILLSDFLLQK